MNQIGIISALIPEAACLTDLSLTPDTVIRIEDNICLYVCGMGAERATVAARKMIEAGMDILVSWGTAGALAPNLNPGDLLVPETILGFDGHIHRTAKHWRTAILNRLKDFPGDIYLGQLADSMRVLTSTDEKTDIARQIKTAMAVDMESAAIAEVAGENEKPVIVMRVISDSRGMIIPEIALRISDPYGRVRIKNLCLQLITRPLQIPELFALARGYRRASATMKWIGQRLHVIFP